MLGAPVRATPCKGLAGLVVEGDEIMSETKEKDDAPADLALIGAAQPYLTIAGFSMTWRSVVSSRRDFSLRVLSRKSAGAGMMSAEKAAQWHLFFPFSAFSFLPSTAAAVHTAASSAYSATRALRGHPW